MWKKNKNGQESSQRPIKGSKYKTVHRTLPALYNFEWDDQVYSTHVVPNMPILKILMSHWEEE